MTDGDFHFSSEDLTVVIEEFSKRYLQSNETLKLESVRLRGLSVRIEENEIVIRLPFTALKIATELCPFLADCEVHYREVWAGEVVATLLEESEGGSTLVHRMFDEAFYKAIERGAEGISVGCEESNDE